MNKAEPTAVNVFQPLSLDKIENCGDYIQLTLHDVAEKELKVDVSLKVAQQFKIGEKVELRVVHSIDDKPQVP